MARVSIIRLVILYTFIYNIPQRIYTQFLAHVFSLPSLVPILLIFSRCIRTRCLLANRRAGLLRLAVSPASLRGWRRRRLTPSPYISHYIYPTNNHTINDCKKLFKWLSPCSIVMSTVYRIRDIIATIKYSHSKTFTMLSKRQGHSRTESFFKWDSSYNCDQLTRFQPA